MNIKRIVIKNLFNTFTHEIIFNENVTIIMGENGVGKTVTLNLIEAIFSSNLEYLLDTEYEEIKVVFKHETWIITRHVKIDTGGEHVSLEISSSKKDAESISIDWEQILPALPTFLEKVDDKTWYNRRNHMFYDRDYVFDKYGMESNVKPFTLPDWIINQQSKNRVKLIKTQRLLSMPSRSAQPSQLMVDVYSKQLANLMQEQMSKNSVNTSDLDRTFPKRVLKMIKKRNQEPFIASEIIDSLHKLEEYRYKLSLVGLMTELKDSENIQEDDLDPEDNTMLAVMHQYIQDSRVKLNSYDSLYKKLSILKKIINIRFKHKILSFDSTQGFIFYPDNPFADIIPVSKLSSGEQNELVLFYELLFKCDEKDLILIDEPEISLHLEWLQEMIGDLKAVTSTNGASLLIATHSPDFVGDNYELVQNLS